MTEQPERATSVGQTGGLPGSNADPRTARISEDEKADTVSMTGTSAGSGEPGGEPETDTGTNG